jgi:Tfp pilus assembly protein PilX
MEIKSINQKERGIAMIVVLFALLLLSVVGLGMMYSTNMESSINGNYRDKQDAFYAALAGIQEGRERIRVNSYSGTTPVYSITPPLVLPSTSAANVIYIVSDASAVQPWNTSNTYFDTELCQENVLSLTGTAGVPCTTTASGTTWYQTFNDSLSSAAPWNLSNPLDWKWTRITLKANNMTPYPVNGISSDAAQTCWNGTNQMSTPTGYSTGCHPVGGVSAIFVTNSGSGYTSTGPTVTIGGDGTGATATAVMQQDTTGYVSAITLTTGGSGYTSAPTVTISGDGTGATVTATLSSSGTTVTTAGSVTVVTLTTGGDSYATAPTVGFSGGGGSGATATATLSTSGTHITSGYVTTAPVTNGGKGYTSTPAVIFTPTGGGSGATATATLGTSGEVVSVSVGNVGTQ